MLKEKLLRILIALIAVISLQGNPVDVNPTESAFDFSFVATATAEAASLQKEETTVTNHTATMAVEDISNKECITVIDLTGIKKMSSAVKWIEDNAFGRNLRFTSTDPELIASWKQATIEAGFKVKNEKVNHKKLTSKAIRILERGDKYSFEIKTIKSQGNDLEKGISYVMSAVGLWAAFK